MHIAQRVAIDKQASRYCPVELLTNFFHMCPHVMGPLFIKLDGSPVFAKDVNTMFSIVVSNELWFIGDKFLQEAFAVVMDNNNHFYLLEEFNQVRSKFSATMLMEHVPLPLMHLLNTHRCIPDMIVVHAGKSDFSREMNKQQHCNVADMTVKVKNLLKPVDTHSEGCWAVFYSHLVSLP